MKQHGGWTPLHAAAMHGDEAPVELFLKHGADRTLKSDDGQTAAEMAASKGYTEIGEETKNLCLMATALESDYY